MAEFHFVEDYERHVRDLKAQFPLDQAMSLAIGGNYESGGNITSDIVLYAGAKSGHSVLDFGCGSGRVGSALSRKIEIPHYLGIDVLQDLLDYAATKTPAHFKYTCHRRVSIPAENDSFDVAYAFSVFTHLLHTETYAYLKDIRRTLKPGGLIVASFLEFAMPSHWTVFEASMPDQPAHPLNSFIERSQWEVWAGHLDLEVAEFINGDRAISDWGPLGQSVAIFRKPG